MKPKEIRKSDEATLATAVSDWRKDLAALKLQASVGQCPNTAKIGLLKKNIARVKTILKERQVNESA